MTIVPGSIVLPADLVRRERDAPRHLHRAVVAQQLVDARSASSDGSRCSSSSWSRLRSSASVPLPIRFTVVSWPAT